RARCAAAARHRFWASVGIDVFCILAAGVMIASSIYSYRVCRRQLKKLASADTQIQSVIDQILDGMITINEKGAVRSMNPAAKRMFGYGENDSFATDFSELIPNCFLNGQDA